MSPFWILWMVFWIIYAFIGGAFAHKHFEDSTEELPFAVAEAIAYGCFWPIWVSLEVWEKYVS